MRLPGFTAEASLPSRSEGPKTANDHPQNLTRPLENTVIPALRIECAPWWLPRFIFRAGCSGAGRGLVSTPDCGTGEACAIYD